MRDRLDRTEGRHDLLHAGRVEPPEHTPALSKVIGPRWSRTALDGRMGL
jgi:hypothetical protein